MLERLRDKYLTEVMTDSASLKCYTVEGPSISLVKQLNISGFCVKDANSIDEEIPTSTRLRSEEVGVPICLDSILG